MLHVYIKLNSEHLIIFFELKSYQNQIVLYEKKCREKHDTAVKCYIVAFVVFIYIIGVHYDGIF